VLISLETLLLTSAQIVIKLLAQEQSHVHDWCRYILKINDLIRGEVHIEQWGLLHVNDFTEAQGACLTSSSCLGTLPYM
jgi:hypothetical protein